MERCWHDGNFYFTLTPKGPREHLDRHPKTLGPAVGILDALPMYFFSTPPRTLSWLWTAIAVVSLALPQSPLRAQALPQGNPETIFPQIQRAQIIHLGEIHDRPEDHQGQLALIRRLHGQNPQLAIAWEMFTQPDQPWLDQYLAGNLTLEALRERTDFDQTWGYDWEDYAPILRFAQEQQLPLIAANVPIAVIRQVAQNGLDQLPPESQALIPPLSDIDVSNEGYRRWLWESYRQHLAHGEGQSDGFENFVAAQAVWDETMADRLAQYAQSHPETQIVMLVGRGHLSYDYGIPDRLGRRLGEGLSQVTVFFHSAQEPEAPTTATDFFWPGGD